MAVAGACSKCPKKTGNQPELFPDIKSADVCTDPDCYREKRAAHAAQLIVTANKAGVPVHEGQEATAMMQQRHYRDNALATEDSGLWLFTRNAPATKNQGKVADFINPEAMPAPVAYVKDSKGELLAFYDKAKLQYLLEAAGACETEEQHTARMVAQQDSPVAQAHAEKARAREEQQQA